METDQSRLFRVAHPSSSELIRAHPWLKKILPEAMAPAPEKTPVPAPSDDDAPGLPGFRTWRGVYVLVFAVFLLVVAGLTVFSRIYS